MRKILLIIFSFILSQFLLAQVGIGTTSPDPSSMLDIIGSDKGVLMPRVSLTGTNDITTITNGNVTGLMIYNTAIISDVTPGFYYWNGSQWNRFSTTSGNTSTITGATNGLSVSGNDAILGGTLNSATTIATTNSNTLALQGLSTGNITSDELVSINPTTGVLTKVTIPSVTGQQTEVIYLASNGQAQFSTPAPYSSLNEISAYRNGVKIGLTAIDPNTIQLETGVTCFSNDEVRIVQNN